jgi:WD40 repeat protein/uncharacterized caspase-like protein
MKPRARPTGRSALRAADGAPFGGALLRLETGQHTAPVRQMQLTADGKTLVSAGDCTLRVWDTATRQRLRVLRGQIGPGVDNTPGHGQVVRFAISRDSRWVVALKSWRAAGQGSHVDLTTELQVFELATGKLQAAFNHPGRWVDLDFSPDGRWLLVAACGPGAGATLHTWSWAEVLHAGFGQAPDTVGSVAFETIAGEDDVPVAARFVPGPASAGGDAHIVVATNSISRDGPGAGRLSWVRLSGTGQLSVQHSALTDGPIDPSTLAVSAAFTAVARGAVLNGPNGSLGQVLCHDHQGQPLARITTLNAPSALAFSSTGGQLIVGLHARQPESGSVQVDVIDTSGGAFKLKSSYYGHDDTIGAVAFCADGTVVSSGGDDQALHFWSPAHRVGAAVGTLRGAGRTLCNAGIDEHGQLSFGAVPEWQLPAGHPKRQQRFNLKTMTLHAMGTGDVDHGKTESTQWLLSVDSPGTSIPLRGRTTEGGHDAPPDLTLFVGSDDEWVLYSPSGYYNASRRGDRHFGYHVNRGPTQEALFLPSDRFSPVFYRRDLIRAIVQHGGEEQARAQGVSIPAVDVTSLLPPVIELAADGSVVQDEQVTLRFHVESPSADNPARRVWLLQNKRFAWQAPQLSATGQYKVTRPLQPGPNTFKLLAEGKRSRSLPVTHTVQGRAANITTTSTDTLPGNLYLLCVGVSQFAAAGTAAAEGFKPLRFAHKDAIAVHDALGRGRFSDTQVQEGVQPSNKAFKEVHAHLLTDEQATKEGILGALNDLCTQIWVRDKTHPAERDVLFVFLAGHGVRIKGQPKLYFWNHDLDPHPEKLDDTGLSMVEVGRIATAVPAEVVIAMDACHSGMAGANTLAGVNAEEVSRRISAVNERGIYVMNAARSEALAHENVSAGHGFFTAALLTALDQEKSLVAEDKGGDEHAVSMLGLIAAIQELVPYLTTQGQTSVFRMYGDLLPLTIYKR